MSDYSFKEPSLQSPKGIAVIFGFSVYNSIKQLFALISLFIYKYIKNENFTTQPIFWLCFCALFIYLLGHAILKFYNFKFHCTDTHFILKTGVLKKDEVSIPKNKIQNVYTKQNILQQLLNVVSLAIETAGDDSTEIEIKALSKPKAMALKDNLNQIDVANKANTKQVKKIQRIVFQPTVAKILLEGITENHFKSFLVLIALIGGFYKDFETFINSLADNYFNYFNEKTFFIIVISNVLFIILLCLLIITYSSLKLLLENFELKVFHTDKGIEISKGLINKINVTLKETKVQTITVKTNIVKERFNLYTLKLSQAMMSKKQQANLKIIGLNKNLLNNFLLKFYPEYNESIKLQKPELYFKRRQIIYFTLFLIIINCAFYFVSTHLYFFNIPVLFFGVLNIHYRYKKASFSISKEIITVTSGNFIDTTKQLVTIKKLQAVILSQSIFQKKRDIASLELITASDSLIIPHIKIKKAIMIQDELIFHLEYNNENWM